MITSAKYHTKKKNQTNKNKRTERTLGQMEKQSYTDKISQRNIHTHKKRKRKKIYVSIYKKKRKRATKSIKNLPVIINYKY